MAIIWMPDHPWQSSSGSWMVGRYAERRELVWEWMDEQVRKFGSGVDLRPRDAWAALKGQVSWSTIPACFYEGVEAGCLVRVDRGIYREAERITDSR